MSVRSSGVLVWRRAPDGVQVLLGHMGGPFWARKDEHAWTAPKGEHTDDETPEAAARREFAEETGVRLPDRPLADLGELRGRKLLHLFAVEARPDDGLDPAGLVSNTFTVEWPPRSGQQQEFPELDRFDWFDLPTARTKLVKGQLPFLDRLASAPDPGFR